MLGAAAVTLAAGAHVFAGGQLPGPGILLGLLALTGLATTAATRLRLASTTMTALLAAGQLVLHAVLSTFSPAAAAGMPVGKTHHTDLFAGPFTPAPAQLPGPDTPLTLGMLAAHVLATVACALLLAKGEDALWSLAAWLRPLVRLPAPVPPAAASPAVAAWPAETPPLPWRNLRRDCRRGPPAAVVFS
jgi:hypothetical protein